MVLKTNATKVIKICYLQLFYVGPSIVYTRINSKIKHVFPYFFLEAVQSIDGSYNSNNVFTGKRQN